MKNVSYEQLREQGLVALASMREPRVYAAKCGNLAHLYYDFDGMPCYIKSCKWYQWKAAKAAAWFKAKGCRIMTRSSLAGSLVSFALIWILTACGVAAVKQLWLVALWGVFTFAFIILVNFYVDIKEGNL